MKCNVETCTKDVVEQSGRKYVCEYHADEIVALLNPIKCHYFQYCRNQATTKYDGLEVCESHEEAMHFDKHRFDDENEKEQEDE